MGEGKTSPTFQKMPTIEDLMRSLDCSRKEAEEILEADKAIDQGKRMDFDLSPEQEKQAIKYANADTHKPISKPRPERKPDELKEKIVAEIANYLPQIQAEQVTIANKNRLISFSLQDRDFELTLTAKRKK